MIKKIVYLPLTSLLLLAFIFSALTLPVQAKTPPRSLEATTSKLGGILRLPSTNVPTTLDPAVVDTSISMGIDLQIFEGLTQLDTGLNVISAIATSWNSTDAITWTFNLRNNVYFHNGRQVKSGDFVYSWNRAKVAGGAYQSIFDSISSYHSSGEYTFVVVLKAAESTFPAKLTMPIFAVIPAENASTIGTHPIGTGPFKFGGWTASKLTLQKHLGYYGTPAFLDGIEYKFYATAADAWDAYQAKNLDLVNVPSDQWINYKTDPNVNTTLLSAVWPYLFDMVAFPDVDVRKALQKAIDRNAIVSDLNIFPYGGLQIANGIVSPGKGTYDNSDIVITYDPTAALSELATAGWTDTNADDILDDGAGNNLTIIVHDSTSTAGHAVAQHIADNFADIGQTGVGAVVTLNTDKNIATFKRGGWMSDYPTPDNDLLPYVTGGGYASIINYGSVTFDGYVNTGLATLNVAARNGVFHSADVQLVVTDAAVLPLYYSRSTPILHKAYVKGLDFNSFTSSDISASPLRYAWIEKNSGTYASGAADGWILETSEVSGLGGLINSSDPTILIGDTAQKKQYRGIFSFSTGAALADNAVVTKAMLRVKRAAILGGINPVTTLQGFLLDIMKGTFNLPALQSADFQATAAGATLKTFGPFIPVVDAGGWYIIPLPSTAFTYINKLATGSGLTQVRLRFKLDDNNNAIANYLSLYSGNSTAINKPQLIIEYYVP